MSDPYLDDVVLLAHLDGADGATSYTPEVGGAFTFGGGAELDTAIKRFGTASLLSDGAAGSLVSTGSAGDYKFLHDGTEAYTVELFLYLDALPASIGFVFDNYDLFGTQDGCYITLSDTGFLGFTVADAGSAVVSFISSSAISTATQYYIALTYDGVSDYDLFIDAINKGTGTATAALPTGAGVALQFAGNPVFPGIDGNIDEIRITRGVSRSITSVPTGPFPDSANFEAYIAVAGPLSQPYLYSEIDYEDAIPVNTGRYSMELTGTPAYEIPITSWQSTVQLEQQNYLQCVIRNAEQYAEEIATRQEAGEEFVIYNVTTYNGVEYKNEIGRALMDNTQFYEGGRNYTCTLAGYSDPGNWSGLNTRTVTGIRSKTVTGAGLYRVSCDIDFLLRPGDDAVADGDTLTVAYINYFAPTGGDSHMEIGER